MLLQQLQTFKLVAEESSFTRAAELLNLSQPAVTRQVASLEAELGVPLIERSGRSFHLTQAGELVVNYAREIDGLVQRCHEEVGALSNPERGQVSVASVTTVGLFTLPGLILDYRRQHPGVRIRVWSGRAAGVLDRLMEGSADIGLTSAPVMHQRLQSVPLFDDPVVPVAAPQVAQGLPDPIPLEMLAELDLILYQAPSRFRTLIDAALEQAGVYARVSMDLDSHEAVRTAVSLGYGVALVPREAVTSELESGTLVQLNVAGLPPITRTTSLVLRRRDPMRLPAVENFVRMILDRYGQQADRQAPPELGRRLGRSSNGNKIASLAAGGSKGGEELRQSQRRAGRKAEA
jgi:DNA-binding transcriptional LysR family regulator